MMKIAGLATILGREAMAKQVIKTISKQVDVMHVCFSQYFRVPEWDEDMPRNVIPETDAMNILHDCARFKWASQYPDAYYFTVDDDLNYPEDYADVMVKYLREADNKAVVSAHGRTLDYSQHIITYMGLDEITWCPVLGAGACAFHTDYIRFETEDFFDSIANSDYMMSLKLASERKRGFVIPRKRNWITPIDNDACTHNSPCCRLAQKHDTYVRRKQEILNQRLSELYGQYTEEEKTWKI